MRIKNDELRIILYLCSKFMNINEKTGQYIRQHADDDVRQLALQGTKDGGVDLPMALQQIAGWQTARHKLPSWAAVDGIVYPPHLNMEQCSSEQTAQYKRSLSTALSPTGKGSGVFVDLTGGFGVDFYWMSQGFQKRIYVEQNEELCAIAEHNFRLLGLSCTVVCGSATDYLTAMEETADCIYLDPARRNEHGGRTYGITDCTPNVLELLPLLTAKAHRVILKLSPMLDWRKAVADLRCVSEVHIVSVDNECKELLIGMRNEKWGMRNGTGGICVACVNFQKDGCQRFAFDATPSAQPISHSPFPISHSSFLISHFLYEPNASIMKAGCFAELEQRFAVRQLSANSHLFLSADEIGDFPGRRFHIETVTTMNKRELKAALAGIDRANIAVRNFPLSADALRQKLKLKDGGEVFIFAATGRDSQHLLFICRKIG